MAERDASWTGQWVADRIRDRPEVTDIQLLHPHVLRIARKDEAPFIVGTLASARVEADAVLALIDLGHEIDLFVNVPKEAFWTGDGIVAVEESGAAFGDMSDLHRAITQPNP